MCISFSAWESFSGRIYFPVPVPFLGIVFTVSVDRVLDIFFFGSVPFIFSACGSFLWHCFLCIMCIEKETLDRDAKSV